MINTKTETEELWNWICWTCKWRGVAQELDQDESLENFYCCPTCCGEEIEDIGWHQGNQKYTGA